MAECLGKDCIQGSLVYVRSAFHYVRVLEIALVMIEFRVKWFHYVRSLKFRVKLRVKYYERSQSTRTSISIVFVAGKL